jgi:formyl-CoA transferase
MSDGALAGVRVLDLATLYPAPLLAAMLGDFGADVVKVEPHGGDPLRTIGAVPWAIAGRNKRSVQVDLDTRGGVELLQRLAAAADVVVCNQPEHVLGRWGCTDDELAARNPRTVIVHVSAFGVDGPYAGRAGNGSMAEAFIGLTGAQHVPTGDTVGALSGVVGVLAALYARDAQHDGRGQVVDVSLYEALLPLLGPRIAGLASPPTAVRAVLVASDGRAIAVSATTDAQRTRLEECAGEDLAAWISARPAAEAVAELVAARVPAVAANTVDELRGDAHVVARESIVTIDDVALPAPAPRLSGTPGRIAKSAPGLGVHTREVVEDWLDEPSAGAELRQR